MATVCNASHSKELNANAWKYNSNQNSNTWYRILIVGMAVLLGKIMGNGALFHVTWGVCVRAYIGISL
jgi:hypothetical protein